MKLQIDSEDLKRLSCKRIDSVIHNEKSKKIVFWTSDGLVKFDVSTNLSLPHAHQAKELNKIFLLALGSMVC